MISINTPKRFDRIDPTIEDRGKMNDWKKTLKTFASHIMVASTALLITATVIGAVVASMDDEPVEGGDDQ